MRTTLHQPVRMTSRYSPDGCFRYTPNVMFPLLRITRDVAEHQLRGKEGRQDRTVVQACRASPELMRECSQAVADERADLLQGLAAAF